MDVATELVERFYNLPGSTVGEKKHSLNLFIASLDNRISEENQRNEFISNLNPQCKLDVLFQLDLLLHYRVYDKVLQLLMSGNTLYIPKILKHWDFFEHTFKSMRAEVFVNEIIPRLSYSTRMKVINRISKTLRDERIANEYFKSIEEKYGIISAKVLLSRCSLDVIKTNIERYNLFLNHKTLCSILKRKLEFIEYYIEYLKVKCQIKNHNLNDILKIILKRDEELFWKITTKHNFYNNKLGKHLSKRLLKNNEDLLCNGSNYVKFKKRTLYEQLRKRPELFNRVVLEQSSTYTCKSRFVSNALSSGFATFVSKERRYHFLNDCFKQVFKCDLHDDPKHISEDLLILMPDGIRNDILMQKVKENDKFIEFCPIGVSVPFIMEKINHSSDATRRVTYTNLLYKTCAFNQDSNYLLELLQYMEKRHRNDVDSLREFFLNLSNWPDIELLSREHWDRIDTIQKLLMMQHVYVREEYFLEKRIGHLLNNNLDISEQMEAYVKYAESAWQMNVFANIPKYRKHCIIELKQYIDKIKDKELQEALQLKYLNFISNYNDSSEDRIPILDFLPQIVTFLEGNHHFLYKMISLCLASHYDVLNPVIWAHSKGFLEQYSLFNWYLSHKEDVLLDNLDLLLQIPRVRKNGKFMRRLSLYSFRGIPERITKYCVNVIRDDQADVLVRLNAVNILSFVDQIELLNIVTALKLPEEGILPIEDCEDEVRFQACALANLKTLYNPAEAISILKSFCKGDYVTYCLKPLQSIAMQLPQNLSVPFILDFQKSAVSVRKHAIYFSKIILPIHNYLEFLQQQCEAEKSASIKTILFKKSLECAAILPTSRCGELIKICMRRIDKDDVDAHDLLLKISNVPKEYKAPFIKSAYEQLNSNTNFLITRKKYELIRSIPIDIIAQFEYEFLVICLSEMLSTYSRNTNVQCWAKFIFYASDEKREKLFDFALTELQRGDSQRPNGGPNDEEIYFMEYLCEEIIKFKAESGMVRRFAAVWSAKFVPEVHIISHINIALTVALAEVEYNIEDFAKKTDEVFRKFLSDYGECLFHIFANEFAKFFNNIPHVNSIEFLQFYLDNCRDTLAILFSIHVLASRTYTVGKENKKNYLDLIKIIKDQPDVRIKIYVYKYLKYIL